MSAQHQAATCVAGPMDGPQSPWHIEAGTSLEALLDSTACPRPLWYALQALTWQFRCETPLWHVLASPRLAPQLVAALLVCRAEVSMAGEAHVAGQPLERILEPGGSGRVASVCLPVMTATWWGEAHVSRAPADEPIVAAWAAVTLEGGQVRQARVALTGVWDVPARLSRAADGLAGAALDARHVQAVAQAIEGEVTPVGDYLGSAEYRRAMASVLTRRALLACYEGAGGAV